LVPFAFALPRAAGLAGDANIDTRSSCRISVISAVCHFEHNPTTRRGHITQKKEETTDTSAKSVIAK
jgi:hypothetical protein